MPYTFLGDSVPLGDFGDTVLLLTHSTVSPVLPLLSAPDCSSSYLLHTSIWAVLQALQLNWANGHLLKGLPASSSTTCLPCNRLQIWLSTVCLSLFSANPSCITFSCRIKANSLEQQVSPTPHHWHCFPLLHSHLPLLFHSFNCMTQFLPPCLANLDLFQDHA